jgi:hypothetical protein
MRAIAFSLALLATARADFSDDQIPVEPGILRRVIDAAESYGLKSYGNKEYAYYLKTARYIGECRSPFGTIHLASLFFIRSAPRGSKGAPRGHTFIVFLDESLKVRAKQEVDFDPAKLSVREGNKIYFGETQVVDYMHPPKRIAIDGDLLEVPVWSPRKN